MILTMENKMQQKTNKINLSHYQDNELEFNYLNLTKTNDFLEALDEVQKAIEVIQRHELTIQRLSNLLNRERRKHERQIAKEKGLAPKTFRIH